MVGPCTLVLISPILINAKLAFASCLINWLTWETGLDALTPPSTFILPLLP